MRVAQILLASAAQAVNKFSSGRYGKFDSAADAQSFCENENANLASDNVDLSGRNGWYWVTNGEVTMAKNARNGKLKSARQMRGSVAFAACTVPSKTEAAGMPIPEPTCTPVGGLENYAEHYQFVADEGIITQGAARGHCQNIGAGWDLVVISGSNEYEFLKQTIDDNCWGHLAFWVGFTETGELAAPGDVGELKTIFGKDPEWKLKWASDSDYGVNQNEPNNQKGVEDCVRMKDGLLNDAVCNDGWTGVKKNGIGMGFVCEKHNYIEMCEPTKKTPDNNPNYQFHTPVSGGPGLNRNAAKASCLALGAGWDLAVVNNAAEHEMLVEQVNCAPNAFWLGVIELDGLLYDDEGNAISFNQWDNHSNVLNPEHNNQQGDENCVRLRGADFNDALCDREWTGPKWLDIPMGYICEYTQPACEVADDALPLNDGEYVVYPQWAPQTVTFSEARAKCKAIGKHWDLIIFNSKREHEMIMDMLAQNCVNDHAYWVGYNENNGVASTVFGNAVPGATTSMELPWNEATNEPNDMLGEENCVRMNAEFGFMNDAICSRTWTGGPAQETGMGVICERHNPCEAVRGQDPTYSYEDEKYYISAAEFVSADDAKAQCQSRGEFWDLVIIDDFKEHKFLTAKLPGCVPYWTGMRNPQGDALEDHDGNSVSFSMWDTHLGHNINEDEPNDAMGDEQCVRMRGGDYNDAFCNDKNGFNKIEKQGYICEYSYKPPNNDTNGPENCLECGQNTGVLPWVTHGGCKEPMDCHVRLEVVDAWKIGNGKSKPVRWGFVGKIKVPEEVIDSGRHFSVLIRFSKAITHGHFQLWNMNFWNFYNGGYEVLIHSKWWNTDRHDKYSVAFVAEELNSDEYPELLFWYERQTQHHCFQPSMHHGQNSNHVSAFGGTARSSVNKLQHIIHNTDPDEDGATSVKIRRGKIVKVKGSKTKSRTRR